MAATPDPGGDLGAVVFLGPPGSGKGTQSRIVAERYGVPQISTGDMFREHVARGTALGKKAKGIMDSGALVPDEIVSAMVEERLHAGDCARGFVLDGFPRTLPQALALESMLERMGRKGPLVIQFDVDYNQLLRRLSGRRFCPQCGKIYNLSFHPPAREGVCDDDGAALVARSDDREEVVAERMASHEAQTHPLVQRYAGLGRLRVVDANRGQPAVSEQLFAVLGSPNGRPPEGARRA
jgi:adenylate kinase